MKRLFQIGGGFFISSIVPIATWILLSLILNDSRISNVFSITYALQFIALILWLLFGTAANIRKEKENDKNAVYNSMFWGTIICTILILICIIFVDQYISFFGQDVEFYKQYVIFSMCFIWLQIIISYVTEKIYFEDNEKKANRYLFIFNIIFLISLITLSILIKPIWICLVITIILLAIFTFYVFLKEFKKFKVSFDFLKNFKYDSANIITYLIMFLIYLFGFKVAFSAGPEYVLALTLIGLCTDAQWDAFSAVSTVAKIDISKNRLNYKQELKNSYIFSIVVIASCLILFFSLYKAYGIVFKIGLVFMAFQMFDMLLHPYRKILSTVIQLEYSAKINTFWDIFTKSIRLVLSVAIISPYCTEIGQVVQGFIDFVFYIIIRKTKFKLNGNSLVLKENIKVVKQDLLDEEQII